MTNDIAGILSLPSSWSLDNFIEAIQVTDFFKLVPELAHHHRGGRS